MAMRLVQGLFESLGYRFYETQMFSSGTGKGNGFDALYVHPSTQEKFIVEVKYDKNGKKKPGKLTIGGQNWRQLSTPYNNKILKEMQLHTGTNEAYNIISTYASEVKLVFIVLNAKDLTLDRYDAGKFFESNLN
jgi:hypothetical protein